MTSDHHTHDNPVHALVSPRERIEELLASIRELSTALGRTGIQLEREVTRAVRTSPPEAGDDEAAGTDIRSLAVENAQLKQALEGRPVIEQAKGMLMARHGCTADQAFQILVLASRRDQRKVRDLATEVVASMVRPRQAPSDLGVSLVRHPAGNARGSSVPEPGSAHPGNVRPPRRVTLPPDETVDIRHR